ncbi:class I SAM-dependent methyltransferase [Rhodohalobacter halophilus]|uniref:class I SAM-dependent methyltransferase n=1 Tax=Rhodohalobacter halophilus TaxID=1812810 RepID=UPI000A000382|nr:class I SAM-dependent methyltransferase [Rhodohalobacter halophilus]
MSRIAYDPVKDRFASIVRNSRLLRRIFYFLLDLFFLRSWHIRRLLKKAGRELDEKGGWNLLDAGSGFGQYDRFILSTFKNVNITAVDVKEDYLLDSAHYFESWVKQKKIRFEKADLLDLSLEEKFHVIICIDVLEHIEQDVQVMKNLSNVLVPGGYFLMHSPSHYSEEDAGDEESFVDEHARPGYSKEDIKHKLQLAGFTPEKIHYTYGFWGHKAWVLSVKWPMLWFNKLGMVAVLPLLLYYPITLPFTLLMNAADLVTSNPKGNGIYALARK